MKPGSDYFRFWICRLNKFERLRKCLATVLDCIPAFLYLKGLPFSCPTFNTRISIAAATRAIMQGHLQLCNNHNDSENCCATNLLFIIHPLPMEITSSVLNNNNENLDFFHVKSFGWLGGPPQSKPHGD